MTQTDPDNLLGEGFVRKGRYNENGVYVSWYERSPLQPGGGCVHEWSRIHSGHSCDWSCVNCFREIKHEFGEGDHVRAREHGPKYVFRSTDDGWVRSPETWQRRSMFYGATHILSVHKKEFIRLYSLPDPYHREDLDLVKRAVDLFPKGPEKKCDRFSFPDPIRHVEDL